MYPGAKTCSILRPRWDGSSGGDSRVMDNGRAAKHEADGVNSVAYVGCVTLQRQSGPLHISAAVDGVCPLCWTCSSVALRGRCPASSRKCHSLLGHAEL